jgi:type I restriction enzyme S subunit
MENGKVAVARGLQGGIACGSTEFHVLRSRGSVLPEYLWFFLRQDSFREEAERHMTGAVGQRRVPARFLGDAVMPLPPIEVQRGIIAKLDALMMRSKQARNELGRIPKLAERCRQAVLDAALRGDLTAAWRTANPNTHWEDFDRKFITERRKSYVTGRRGSRLRDAPPLLTAGEGKEGSLSWMFGCLADAADLRVGYAFKSAWFAENGPKLLRGANIAPGRVIWEDLKCLTPDKIEEFKEFRLHANDIVIAMDRPVISSGLKIAILGSEDDGAFLVQRVASPACSRLIDPRFLWLVLNSRLFIEHIEQHATGSDLPHISGNDILTTFLPLPHLEEQKEIVRCVEAALAHLDQLASEVAHSLALLDSLEQASLAKAFRGDLVSHDPAEELRVLSQSGASLEIERAPIPA